MVQPINYLANMPQVDIGESLIQGLQVGATFRQMQQQQAARQQAEQRLQAYRSELENAFSQGRPEAFERLMTLFPEHQAAVKPQYDRLSKVQQQNELSSVTNVRAAIETGNTQYAKQLIERQIQAAENSNADASMYKNLLEKIDIDPKMVASNIDYTLSTMLGPKEYKEWAEGISKVGETRRAEAMAPVTMRKETAETISKELENKFKPEKFAADLGLTKAQIEQVKASTAASRAATARAGAETERAQAETRQMVAGIIPVDKRPEAESKFRKEYSDQTKGYQEVKSAYGRVLASEDNAVGDLSLIFGYMKMLDPGSVVREGEFATAQNAAGVPERIQNIYNQALSGQRLSSSQRKLFKGQAEKLYQTAQKQEVTVRDGIGRIAKGYGLNTANIFYEATETAPAAPSAKPPAPAAPGAPISVTAPNGQVLTFPNQQAADAFKKAAGL